MKIKRYFVNIAKGVSIPVFDVGKFDVGFVTFVCQLHGDEYASQRIIESLLISVKSLRLTTGIRIIACANPVGSSLGLKNDPISSLNLNRQFYPGTPLKKFFKEMKKLISGSIFCVDVHDMPGSQLPLSSIITLNGNTETEKLSLKLLNNFGPVIYWLEDFSNSKIAFRYKGTINSYLNSIGIPNFSIETSPIEIISQKEVDKIVSKLVPLIKNPFIKQRDNNSLFIKRVEIFSPNNGIVIPLEKELMSYVKKGQVLGYLLLPSIKRITIAASASGLLIRKTLSRYVFKGQKLFDIGLTI